MHQASHHSETARATGFIAPGFDAVRDDFDSLLRDHPHYGAQVAATWRGRTVVDLVGGANLHSESISGVFSVTKGVAATVIGMLIDQGLLDLDNRVSQYWPEFAAAGKAEITVRQLLSHRAGVIGVQECLTIDDLVDSAKGAAKLAESPSVWRPDTAHGYHAITIGVLMEELTRRVSGRSLQEIYETDIRAPRGIDFYLGLPDTEEGRVVDVLPPAPSAIAETPALGPTDTLQSLAFNVLHSRLPIDAGDMGPNNRQIRAAGIASVGGVGSARGLASLYSAVLGSDEAPPLVSKATIALISQQHSFGIDRVLGMITSFGIVYMKPHPQMEFGSYRAFGHDGMGGALGFADPLHDLAFGYIPSPIQPPGGADPKGVQLSQRIRECIRTLA